MVANGTGLLPKLLIDQPKSSIWAYSKFRLSEPPRLPHLQPLFSLTQQQLLLTKTLLSFICTWKRLNKEYSQLLAPQPEKAFDHQTLKPVTKAHFFHKCQCFLPTSIRILMQVMWGQAHAHSRLCGPNHPGQSSNFMSQKRVSHDWVGVHSQRSPFSLRILSNIFFFSSLMSCDQDS